MGVVRKVPENVYEMPRGSYVCNGCYVYVHVSNEYVPASRTKAGKRGYTGHRSVGIGVLVDPSDPSQGFYANQRYVTEFLRILPAPREFCDSLRVGLFIWAGASAERLGLAEVLEATLGRDGAALTLDLACYMLSTESAVMQHFPDWGREHPLRSGHVPTDTEVGTFLRDGITFQRTCEFRERWAPRAMGDGRVYLCYDSTNVNCTAGFEVVEKGYAKDDPSKPQVNADYVVRQSDALPVTYLHSPGSVNDIAQAKEMIKSIGHYVELARRLAGLPEVDVEEVLRICMVCDRGYISRENLALMDKYGIGYLLMFRETFKLWHQLASAEAPTIRNYRNAVEDGGDECYAVTRTVTMYEGGPECLAHVVWSADLHDEVRHTVTQRMDRKRRGMEAAVGRVAGRELDEDELKGAFGWAEPFLTPVTEPGKPKVKEVKRGRRTIEVEVPTWRVTGYEEHEDEVNLEYQKAGTFILVGSEPDDAQTALDRYRARDNVEKTFRGLKSWLGMDKIGVTTQEAMHGKGLVWFVASILRADLFNGTRKELGRDRKGGTVPCMVRKLEAIHADRGAADGDPYERRYELTRQQKRILAPWGIGAEQVDAEIGKLNA